jgi:HEAT repeat protein
MTHTHGFDREARGTEIERRMRNSRASLLGKIGDIAAFESAVAILGRINYQELFPEIASAHEAQVRLERSTRRLGNILAIKVDLNLPDSRLRRERNWELGIMACALGVRYTPWGHLECHPLRSPIA